MFKSVLFAAVLCMMIVMASARYHEFKVIGYGGDANQQMAQVAADRANMAMQSYGGDFKRTIRDVKQHIGASFGPVWNSWEVESRNFDYIDLAYGGELVRLYREKH